MTVTHGIDETRALAGPPALSQQQRALVEQNLGLIAVHLQRFVRNLAVPRRDREWEDLFQEGCLGLMRAAADYDPARGIPFAAFALPRIHNFVSRALHRKFSTIYVPPVRKNREPDKTTDAVRRPPCTTYSLSDEQMRSLPTSTVKEPDAGDKETIGQRLRKKYERAVRSVARVLSLKTSARGDRDKLVHCLVEERYLIPDEDCKTALRQIARDTQSSYARVAQCDKQLVIAIRKALERDPEFEALRARARSAQLGDQEAIDAELENELAKISANAFVREIRSADPERRVHLIDTLLTVTETGLDDVIYSRVARMPTAMREKLFHAAGDSPLKRPKSTTRALRSSSSRA